MADPGFRLTLEGFPQLREALSQLSQQVKNPKPLLNDLGEELLISIDERFKGTENNFTHFLTGC